MNSSVIDFPGSNCDRDIAVALEKMQFKNQMVWHKETKLPKSDLIVLPGGFSYGDYLRSGAIAGKSLIIDEVIKAANSGCLILGICNGFQILTETGLLKGTLLRNKNLKFIKGDILEETTKNEVINFFKSNLDVIISDMAADTTGNKSLDSIRTNQLCTEVINFSKNTLKPKGVLVSKLFMGEDFIEVKNLAKSVFKKVNFFKPESSRKESKETYLHCEILKSL